MKEEDKPLKWLKSNPTNPDDKLDYVLSSPIGTIVAFNTENDGVKSGAIVSRTYSSSGSLVIETETEYGASYIISFKDVLWVKTGTRWPKWVYNKFKE